MQPLNSLGRFFPIAATAALFALLHAGMIEAQEATEDSVRSDFERSFEALEAEDRDSEQRERARQAYIEETDALIQSIEDYIFNIRLAATEFRFVQDNFKCESAKVFSDEMRTKLAFVEEDRRRVLSRCERVDPLNLEGQALCDERLSDAERQTTRMETWISNAMEDCERR